MGAIRWTGKGLKIVGELLSAEEVEAWVEAKGKAYVESKLKGLTLKWLAGQTRATRQVFSEISGAIASDTFRSALLDTLAVLPNVLEAVTDHVQTRSVPGLCYGSYPDVVTIVPRAVVQREYRSRVVAKLKDSAELERFAAFPEIFLVRKADKSEDVFFRGLQASLPFLCPSKHRLVIAIDDRFDWQLGSGFGHYYCAGASVFTDLGERRSKRDFLKKVEGPLDEAKVSLGSLNAVARSKASAMLATVAIRPDV